ncbi:hypothetical protein HKD37_13G038714 [Glycine soja]
MIHHKKMASISQGLVLTSAMLLSTTLLYVAFSRQKTTPSFQIHHSNKPTLRSCLYSEEKKRERKKKKVKFADSVKEGRERNEQRSNSRQSGGMPMPANRMALYYGILRNRSSGCLGPFKKPPLIATADVPPKGLRKQGKAAKKPSTSEDFWITSTHDMDNSAVQSQGSISSASITNQAADPHGGSCNPTEFVNHGLILWNQTRQAWIGNKRSKNQTEQLREPKLSWNATYESLLGSNKPFPQHISLAEMVEFLVDIWEQEGLYD